MSIAPPLPGRVTRDELVGSEREIADLNAGREAADSVLIERIENYHGSVRGRLGAILTLGYVGTERANLDRAVAERAASLKQGRGQGQVIAPLKALAAKADSKLEALRDIDRGYQHVIDYYQNQIRLKTPEGGYRVQRMWRRLVGPGREVREAERKLALASTARASRAAKLAPDPREQMRREIAANDRDIRLLLLRVAPSLSPRVPALLQALAAGDDKPLEAALRAEQVSTDDSNQVMALAENLRGEYAGVGRRVLGALGTIATLGYSKKTRALARGAQNERGIELATYYSRQADERAVYEMLSVAGQVRVLPSLPIGTVLTISGQQMAIERLQEKKGRRAIRLIQVNEPRRVFLLDITEPDSPILRRAVNGGKELPYRAYRDAGSRLPAFGPRDERAVDGDGRESLLAATLAAVAAGNGDAARASINDLNNLLSTTAVSIDPRALQDDRTLLVANLNTRFRAAGSSAQVRLVQEAIQLEMPVPSPAPTPVVPVPTPAPTPIPVPLAPVPTPAVVPVAPVADPISAAPSLESQRKATSGALNSLAGDLRTLNAEHRLPENHNAVWWNAHRENYINVREACLHVIHQASAHETDSREQDILLKLANRVTDTFQQNGDFPGGHPAIDSLLDDLADVSRTLQPAAAIS